MLIINTPLKSVKRLRLWKRPKDSCPVFVGNRVNLLVAWKDEAGRRKRSGRCHLTQLLEIALESRRRNEGQELRHRRVDLEGVRHADRHVAEGARACMKSQVSDDHG